MRIKIFITIFAILLGFAALVQSQEYYADLNIDINNNGIVSIEGITNDPSLYPGIYQDFTSKKGSYWLFNLSSEKEFSDYIISVRLPRRAEFNYFKSDGRSRVSYDDGIKIVSLGSGEINFVVQYKISNNRKSVALIIYLIAVLVIVGIAFAVLFYKKQNRNIKDRLNMKGRSAKETIKEGPGDKIILIKKTLSENQEKIVDLLLQNREGLTQKQIQHRLGIPKATLSRNIDLLLKKDIIVKQSRGLTNMIRINEEFA